MFARRGSAVMGFHPLLKTIQKVAIWCYEEEQRRLQRLFDEVETDPQINEDSETDVEEDRLEIQPEDTESEQDMSDGMPQQDTEKEYHRKC
ncbi:hypothetical protein QE152_g34418 [Popillia japonica]|uniref:Uncharacterized protein n=1 Tax=Popillia japonica TaxID=7064 RepID=A0AAW1ITQ8_POPJA